MKEYFLLQLKMLNRKTIEFGVPLIIGYTFVPIIFILISYYLFSKTEYAVYLFLLIGLSFISKLSEPRRNYFLKSIFNKPAYLKLRILENLICSIPFVIFLSYKELFYFALILIVLAITMATARFNTNFLFTLPSPFGKKPFEYLIGFRKTFFIFPFVYFLSYLAITESNFNLGILSMLLIALICVSFYSKPENEYFVWNFSLTSKRFLLKKLKSCLINFTLLGLPILVTLGFFFFSEIHILIAFFLLCYAYLATFLFAKYSAFPNETSLAQGILIGISIALPPFLIVILPLFYSQSIKKLNTILE